MTRATATDWQLQLGAHLLKKGCGFYVGQIIKEKKIGDKRYRVSVITNLVFDFKENKICHTADKKIVNID